MRTGGYPWLGMNETRTWARTWDVTVYIFVKQVILGMFQIFLVTIYDNNFFELHASSKMAIEHLSCSLDFKGKIDNRMFDLQTVVRCHMSHDSLSDFRSIFVVL